MQHVFRERWPDHLPYPVDRILSMEIEKRKMDEKKMFSKSSQTKNRAERRCYAERYLARCVVSARISNMAVDAVIVAVTYSYTTTIQQQTQQ